VRGILVVMRGVLVLLLLRGFVFSGLLLILGPLLLLLRAERASCIRARGSPCMQRDAALRLTAAASSHRAHHLVICGRIVVQSLLRVHLGGEDPV
jgi:hypothetical protein